MSLNSDLISVRFWSDSFQAFRLLHQKTSEVRMFKVSKGGFAPGRGARWSNGVYATIKVAVGIASFPGIVYLVPKSYTEKEAKFGVSIRQGQPKSLWEHVRKLPLFPSEWVVVWPATGFPGNFWADNPFEPWESEAMRSGGRNHDLTTNMLWFDKTWWIHSRWQHHRLVVSRMFGLKLLGVIELQGLFSQIGRSLPTYLLPKNSRKLSWA